MDTENKVHFTSESNEWGTPQELFDELDKEFHFTLDPCATVQNAKCEKFYTKEQNGLTKDWKDEIVFMNPPYGREIKDWIYKAYVSCAIQGITVVALIPARTDTRYWHGHIFPFYNKKCKHGCLCNRVEVEIRFIKGRLKFEKEGCKPNSAPFPSAIIIWKKGGIE